MNTAAKNTILRHAGFLDEEGFVAKLRPFQSIAESDFVEIFVSLITLHPDMQKDMRIDKELLAAIWDICYRTRLLALGPGSGLRQNHLISESEVEMLDSWIDCIDVFMVRTLRGLDISICLSRFLEYIATSSVCDPSRYRHILPHLERCRQSDDVDVPGMAEAAITRVIHAST